MLQAIKDKPEVLFIDELPILAVREQVNVPTLFLKRMESVSDEAKSGIILIPHTQYEADKNDELIRQSCRFDLLEPFDRIQHAVAILGEKDERFR